MVVEFTTMRTLFLVGKWSLTYHIYRPKTRLARKALFPFLRKKLIIYFLWVAHLVEIYLITENLWLTKNYSEKLFVGQ